MIFYEEWGFDRGKLKVEKQKWRGMAPEIEDCEYVLVIERKGRPLIVRLKLRVLILVTNCDGIWLRSEVNFDFLKRVQNVKNPDLKSK